MSDGADERRYFVRSMGKVAGPFDVGRLKRLRSRGQFGPGAEVSVDKRHWKLWNSIEDLQENAIEAGAPAGRSDAEVRAGSAELARQSPLTALWHYSINSSTFGPVNRGDLLQLVADGTLNEENLVYRDGMVDWMPIGEVAELSRGTKTKEKKAAGGVDPNAYRPRYANFWRRLGGLVIDGSILPVIGFALGFTVTANLIVMGFTEQQLYIAAFLSGAILNWMYYAAMESSQFQATFGKLAMELKVTTISGGRISFGQASARYFAKILSALLFFIGFIMAAFTEKRQALHDLLTDCLVVDQESVRP